MTNGDRIRQMTDEELADFFCQISNCCVNDASCSLCPIFDGCAQNASIEFDENCVPIAKKFWKSRFCPNCGAKMDGGEKRC